MMTLNHGEAILLDFDGPICSVFAGYPAACVANNLRMVLSTRSIVISTSLATVSDPLAVLRWTPKHYPETTEEIDAALVEAEKMAVLSADPTAHARRAIVAAQRVGCPVAIVSNNSLPAITDYLERHGMSQHVATVAARPFGKPDEMKPNPAFIHRAIQQMAVAPERCVS